MLDQLELHKIQLEKAGRQIFGHTVLREEQLFLLCMGGMRHTESLVEGRNGGWKH